MQVGRHSPEERAVDCLLLFFYWEVTWGCYSFWDSKSEIQMGEDIVLLAAFLSDRRDIENSPQMSNGGGFAIWGSGVHPRAATEFISVQGLF